MDNHTPSLHDSAEEFLSSDDNTVANSQPEDELVLGSDYSGSDDGFDEDAVDHDESYGPRNPQFVAALEGFLDLGDEDTLDDIPLDIADEFVDEEGLYVLLETLI